MKFRVTMKDPDCQYEATLEAARESLKDLPLTADEKELLVESRQKDFANFADQWMEYGEYLCVEFDTDAKTATLIKT